MAESSGLLRGSSNSISYNTDNGLAHWLEEKDASRNVVQSTDKSKIVMGCVPIKWLNAVLVVLTIITNVAFTVMLPIYAGAINKAGGDTFVVLFYGSLWFPVIFAIMTLVLKFTMDRSISLKPSGNIKVTAAVGFFTSINGVLIVYASPPNRTPPYLQGILTTLLIPYTVILRYFVLKKAISIRRLVCVGVVLIGLFITVEPQIWGLDGSGESGDTGPTGAAKFYWPLIFAIGFIPGAMINVLTEKQMKSGEAESMSFITWVNVFQVISNVLLFWTDFIPGFGEANSFSKFIDLLSTGIGCNFSLAPDCHGVLLKSWIFILTYCLSNFFSFLLIRYAEGAVYAAVVQALVTPLATFFWSLFNDDTYLMWDPVFNITTVFTIAGLCIIMPGVLFYNYFSSKETAPKEETVVIQ